MPEIYTQNISGCMADMIGDDGLTGDALEMARTAAWDVWSAMRADIAEGGFPAVSIAQQSDDLAAVRDAAARLSTHCDTVAVIGVGGSSLGAEALCALGPTPPVDVRFLNNPDPETVARFKASVDFARVGLVMVSKSGGTAETLTLAMTLMPALIDMRGGDAVADYSVVIVEPGDNPIGRLAARWGVPVIEHPVDIGGRYSALTAVGLLPAALAGLDIAAVRAGAVEALETNLAGKSVDDVPAALGAAVSLALLQSQGARMSVLMPYADALAPFARWYRQLWAESVGKNGFGTTPIDALGSVDQHSQLQLYLDGPRDKMFTIVTQQLDGRGDRVSPELATFAGAAYLAGQTTGDLLAAEQEATIESLCAHGRPVRRIEVPRVDEAAIGALMVHFMLETVTAAFMLGIDPFDQPAVDDGKERARQRLAEAAGSAGGVAA
ncbi:MAG: glucose-6-phosphate isomerase [Proteobacteria bacterium]|nr:glucose-6-phosphate isomerase [Pseudomonadota bacterium]